MEQQPSNQNLDPFQDEQDRMRMLNGAFEAYRQLRQIQQFTADSLWEFEEGYIASYPSMDALVEDLTDLNEQVAETQRLANEQDGQNAISLIRTDLERIVYGRWHIVENDGRLHVFGK